MLSFLQLFLITLVPLGLPTAPVVQGVAVVQASQSELPPAVVVDPVDSEFGSESVCQLLEQVVTLLRLLLGALCAVVLIWFLKAV